MAVQSDVVLLRVNRLKKYFPVRRGVFRRIVGWVKAVDEVDFFIRVGEPWGLWANPAAERPPVPALSSA